MTMDRRTFIDTTSRAALGALVVGVPRIPRGAAKLDRIGLQLYTVRKEMEHDVDATLAQVAAAGYSDVEFAGYFKKSPQEIRAMLDRHGLASPSAHSPLGTADEWHATVDAAHVIGHHYIVVPWIPAEQRHTLDDWKRIAHSFNEAGARARDAGIQLAYHNHDFEFAPIEGKLPYDVLLAETDPKLVQLEIDLYWMTKGGQDPLTYFARWPGRVPLVHVKDSAGPPEHRMMDVGAGTIDWKRILAKREQAGIRHCFVEHDQPADAFASIRASCAYLKRLEF